MLPARSGGGGGGSLLPIAHLWLYPARAATGTRLQGAAAGLAASTETRCPALPCVLQRQVLGLYRSLLREARRQRTKGGSQELKVHIRGEFERL